MQDPQYQQFWGIVLNSDTTSNATLGGTTITPTYDESLYWVNDPENGGVPNNILDDDFLDSISGGDDTTGQPGEGIATSDGGAPNSIIEIGFFPDSTIHLSDGQTAQTTIYAFRLDDGRIILRTRDGEIEFLESMGYTRDDVKSITLGEPDSYQTLACIQTTDFDDDLKVPCFANGTLIETADGPVAVEDLRPGMMVRTADRGYQPLRLAMSRQVGSAWQMQNQKLCPVRISAGALGNGLPLRDLRVSRQHRILASSPICERMFGTREVLVPAIRLTDLPGIFIEEDGASVSYFHLLFDRHEVIFAEGAAAESLFLGPHVLEGLSPEARKELLTLFPNAAELCEAAVPARRIPEGSRIRGLIDRHAKNGKPLVQQQAPRA